MRGMWKAVVFGLLSGIGCGSEVRIAPGGEGGASVGGNAAVGSGGQGGVGGMAPGQSCEFVPTWELDLGPDVFLPTIARAPDGGWVIFALGGGPIGLPGATATVEDGAILTKLDEARNLEWSTATLEGNALFLALAVGEDGTIATAGTVIGAVALSDGTSVVPENAGDDVEFMATFDSLANAIGSDARLGDVADVAMDASAVYYGRNVRPFTIPSQPAGPLLKKRSYAGDFIWDVDFTEPDDVSATLSWNIVTGGQQVTLFVWMLGSGMLADEFVEEGEFIASFSDAGQLLWIHQLGDGIGAGNAAVAADGSIVFSAGSDGAVAYDVVGQEVAAGHFAVASLEKDGSLRWLYQQPHGQPNDDHVHFVGPVADNRTLLGVVTDQDTSRLIVLDAAGEPCHEMPFGKVTQQVVATESGFVVVTGGQSYESGTEKYVWGGTLQAFDWVRP